MHEESFWELHVGALHVKCSSAAIDMRTYIQEISQVVLRIANVHVDAVVL